MKKCNCFGDAKPFFTINKKVLTFVSIVFNHESFYVACRLFKLRNSFIAAGIDNSYQQPSTKDALRYFSLLHHYLKSYSSAVYIPI